MTIFTPYGVTCQILGDPSKFSSFRDHEIIQLRYMAPPPFNLIVRVQFTTHEVVSNCHPYDHLSCYDFNTWVNPIVQAINANGLICHLAFQASSKDEGNGWLDGTCPATATGKKYMLADNWAIFAGNVATYYTNNPNGYHIEIIECGNEDYNFNNKDAGFCNSPVDAALTATAVYQAVKRANTNILVGTPATNSISNLCGAAGPDNNACDWWRNFFQAGPQADFVNYHQYPGGVICCGGQHCYTLLQEAQYIHSMNQNCLPGNIIPIWLTEIGFSVGGTTCEPYGGNINEGVQATLLTETMEAGRTSGGLIQVICWYTMYYDDYRFSLIYPKDKLRPAYTAYLNYIAQHPTWP